MHQEDHLTELQSRHARLDSSRHITSRILDLPTSPGAFIILCILDGLGDLPITELGERTPLEVASTPVLDLLAETGYVGLMDPVEPGLACGSDTAHLSILGYDPRIYYNGRGAFESIGAGLEMQPGDLAFKSIFSYVEDPPNADKSISSTTVPPIVVRRRCATDFRDWGVPLCEALCTPDRKAGHIQSQLSLPEEFSDVSVVVKYATEHRCGVRIRSALGPLSDAISGTDPLKDGRPMQPCVATLDPSDGKQATTHQLMARATAERTALICNTISKRFNDVLMSHPITQQRINTGKPYANVVLLRGGAACPMFPSFKSRTGLRPCYIAPTAVVAGLLTSLGFTQIKPSSLGATGETDSNLGLKAECLAEAFGWAENGVTFDSPPAPQYDFGLLHVKGTDEASHSGEPGVKASVIERFDSALGLLLRRYSEYTACLPSSEPRPSLTIAVTGDHTTACGVQDHIADPVPFLAVNVASGTLKRILAKEQSSFAFSERSAIQEASNVNKGLGRFSGLQVIPLLMQLAKEVK